MSEPLTLDLLDKDGAIRDALHAEGRGTRADLFRRAPSARRDAAILNFALLLEYLESEFYVDAVGKGALSGATLAFATTVRDHELAHVEFLKGALGGAAGAKPAFDFKDTTSDPAKFVATAIVLEDTGVAAYNGQGPRLRRRSRAAAAQIVSVEARHAAWIRHIAAGAASYPGGPAQLPAPADFEPALSKRQVERAVAATGFIAG